MKRQEQIDELMQRAKTVAQRADVRREAYHWVVATGTLDTYTPEWESATESLNAYVLEVALAEDWALARALTRTVGLTILSPEWDDVEDFWTEAIDYAVEEAIFFAMEGIL